MKHTLLYTLLALMALLPTTARAQSHTTSFRVMTLNVDGLPRKFTFLDINPDGPGSPGSERISQYIAAQDPDIVAMQECFNYRWEIWSRLFAAYEHDEWTGGISLEEHDIDWRHPQHTRFPCDGLNTAWHRDIRSTAYERVAHRQSFGKFSHAFDDLITKGFRRHELTLADGTQVVVYNTHFDASDDTDVALGRDARDREARRDQWRQLRDHVLTHLDRRPVILTGDFNSLYTTDSILSTFIDPIEATGRATVGDCWVRLCNGNAYPALGNDTHPSEPLDKILYVNPTGGLLLEPIALTVDTVGYLYDGQPLGDHYPVTATFAVSDPSGIVFAAPTSNADRHGRAYTLRGTSADPRRRGVVISNRQKRINK